MRYKDIYTEAPADPNTAANLGPLAPLPGVWYGEKGVDTHPQVDGPETEPYHEEWSFELLDPQNNGPQVLYGMRYHVAITKPGELSAFHEQVGHILYEPETNKIFMTLSIPRGQAAMAVGEAKPGDKSFTVRAVRGSHENGIVSNPFLEEAFKTTEWVFTITFNEDGTIDYEQTTTLVIPGQDKPFAHTDKNHLHLVRAAAPNAAMIDAGLLNRNPK